MSTGRVTKLVSHRFLSDLFRVLERYGVPVTELLGDLPIEVGEAGEVLEPVEWPLFVELMRRLERSVDGPEGVEACGAILGDLKPAGVLRGLGGLAASPFALYRGAIRWALRRALPGIRVRMTELEGNTFEVHAHLAEGLEPCPPIFHFATGGARVLPRLLGLADAVVSAEVFERGARYRIALPPSLTLMARMKRVARSMFSAGSVLQFLETQQLELHAQHAALERAQAALNANEQRYRALTDAALDVLCELDRNGRVVFVSASIQDLIGYSTDQVTGSHFHLWVPKELHARADTRFAALTSRPPGRAIARELVTLHAENGRRIVAEASVRSYVTDGGEWRLVAILRDVTPRGASHDASGRGEDAVASDVDRLRSVVRELKGKAGSRSGRPERSGHPLARSLAALVGALDRLEARAASPADELAVAASSRRMTQIVTAALVGSESVGSEAEASWIETRKLLDAVRTDFAASHGDTHLDFRTGRAPVEIWGRIDLLAGGLGGLLDRARELAPPGSRFVLEVSHADGGADDVGWGTGLEFAVRVTPAPAAGGIAAEASHRAVGTGTRPETTGDDDPAVLAGAIARDVAALLDAELELALPELGPGGSRLRLAQPAPPGDGAGQSSTRSMSAPSWRSFSSTRS